MQAINDVLVVEHNGPVRMIIEELLRRRGYNVHGFASAEEALVHVKATLPGGAILGQELSGQTSEHLAVELRRRSPGMRVVFFTADDQPGRLEASVPGCKVVSKGQSVADLIGDFPALALPDGVG